MPLFDAYASQYLFYLFAISVACVVVVIKARSKNEAVQVTSDFTKFQKTYLYVYLLAMAADWLQGPYVYALYESYGFSRGEIGALFIYGFGSSLVVGTFVGSLADTYGRKRNVQAFCIIYMLSCLTKHSSDYYILVFGRILGGCATSILFSAFESWMISEHKTSAFPPEWLGQTFSYQTFLNGIIAIIAGIFASMAVSFTGDNLVVPFDLSFVVLLLLLLVVTTTWTENYGERQVDSGMNVKAAYETIAQNPRIALLGIIQSCFEASMYLFVFMWTPMLSQSLPEGATLPHGLVFAIFMVAVMIGSHIVTGNSSATEAAGTLRMTIAISCLCIFVPCVTGNHTLLLFAFIGFEVTVGLYFPSIGVMRGEMIPEEHRATIMNLYRVGLNLFVILVLVNIDDMDNTTVFIISLFLLLVALICQHNLLAASTGTKDAQAQAIAELQGQDEDAEAGLAGSNENFAEEDDDAEGNDDKKPLISGHDD